MDVDQLSDGDKIPFTVDGINILLIKINQKIHIIENRCGHFGVPLVTGTLDDNSIICSQHFAKFDLLSGKVMNDSVEQCDEIAVYDWAIENHQIVFTGDKKTS